MASEEKPPIDDDIQIIDIIITFFDMHNFLGCKQLETDLKSLKSSSKKLNSQVLLESTEKMLTGLQSIVHNIKKEKEESAMAVPIKVEEESAMDVDKETLQKDLIPESDKKNKKHKTIIPICTVPPPEVDPSLVQVRAGKNEIERRIKAFIERKQLELNTENCREFCNTTEPEAESDSCARVTAVFIPRGDSKSHVEVCRVHNLYGPQTRPQNLYDSVAKDQQVVTPDVKPTIKPNPVFKSQAAVDERLNNLEQHLGLKNDLRQDVFSRLKSIEDRVLQLESLSPEYFTCMPAPKRQRTAVINQDHRKASSSALQGLTLMDIEEKIHMLKKSLRQKQQQVQIKEEFPSDLG